MPGFDRTGPRGEGPMTGGSRGVCVSDTPALPGDDLVVLPRMVRPVFFGLRRLGLGLGRAIGRRDRGLRRGGRGRW